MENLEKYFLGVLSDYIWQRKSQVSEEMIYQMLSSIKQHQLSSIFYYQLKSDALANDYAFQISNYCNRVNILKNFEDVMKGQDYILFKGAVISEMYPQPMLRTMGDIDILIKENDREAVNGILISNGFKLIEQSNIVWTYEKKSFMFEIHTQLIYPCKGNEKIQTFFNDPWTNVVNNKLNLSYHFLYLVIHICHHMITGGVGFRQFLDLAEIIHNNNLNWDWIEESAKIIGMEQFINNVLILLHRWFDIQVPIENGLTDSFYTKATNYIMSNGVFGYNNLDNQYSELSKIAVYQKKQTNCAKTQYFLNTLFPSFDAMKRLPYCSYLLKCKYLLVFAWFHRFILRVFNKNSMENFVKQFGHNSDAGMYKIELLREFGL